MREKLLQAYKAHGYDIRTGESVTRWIETREFAAETVLCECASAWKDGRRLDTGYGLSWQELAVLEFLAAIWTPRAIFGIGNGFGWSAVAMRLLWRWAWMTMLDDESEGGDAREAAELTNAVMKELSGCHIVAGRSPTDVPTAVNWMKPLPLVLIDACHTDEAQLADYRAVKPFLAPEHVVLFHDVLFCRMEASFQQIAEDYPSRSRILRRTTTGMGIVWTADAGRRCAEVFGG